MQNDQWSETHCHRQVAGNCHEFHQLLGSLHSTHDSDTSPKNNVNTHYIKQQNVHRRRLSGPIIKMTMGQLYVGNIYESIYKTQ